MSTSKVKVEGFTGSGVNKAIWKDRLLEALEIPVASRPLEFYDRSEAQKSIAKTINDKFNVPFFDDVETAWRWEQLSREVVQNLKSSGQIDFPSWRELWIKETRAARLATAEHGANDNGSQEAADEGVVQVEEVSAIRAEAHKAGCDEGYGRGYTDGHQRGFTGGHHRGYTDGYQRGHCEGYKKGKEEALVKIIEVAQRFAQEEEPDNSTGPSPPTQLEASTQTEASPDKLEFQKPPTASEDQILLHTFESRPGTFAGASGTSESPKREGSVSSSNIVTTAELPFPDHHAGNVVQDPATLSRLSPARADEDKVPTAPSPSAKSTTGPKQSTTPGPSTESPFTIHDPGLSQQKIKPSSLIASIFLTPARPLFGESTPLGRAVHPNSPATKSTISAVDGVKNAFQPDNKEASDPTTSGTMGPPSAGLATADGVYKPIAEPVDKSPSQYGPGLRKRRFEEESAECDEFSKSRVPPSVKRFRG
ncbi:hypothetical protein HDK90DRAFT_540724 [Phyllosticta capitalensis]|uniref:Uncharacterized protein n=1 Tax=Phyllosticta capitalensis TaxID=121624 RepID=A0ABR1YDM9_9PEZI